MYVKIEPSGCCERKGLIQIRLSMYLDEADYGYNRHIVKVKDENSDVETTQVNPFHNHFIYVEPSLSEDKIMDMAEAYLHEAYRRWELGEKMDLLNYGVVFPGSKDNLTNRVEQIKAITQTRSI